MASVAYPHVTNSTSAIRKDEVVVASNFNAFFVLKGQLAEKLGNYGFLSEYVKSVTNLFVEKSEGVIEAGYKTTKFRYDSNEKETIWEIEVQFFNFLDDKDRQFVYNALLAWSRVKNNMLTGEKTLKKVYSDADLVVEKYQRDQRTIHWRRVAHSVFPMGNLPDQVADYATHEMTELSMQFNADYVSDVTNDPRLAGEKFTS